MKQEEGIGITAEQLTAERVINVHTTKPYEWVVDNVFNEAQVGRRLRTLFWKSDKPNSSHFFIEFADRQSVQLAQHAVVPGVTVHCLSRNMNMYPIYDCLVHGKELPAKKRPNSDAGVSPLIEVPEAPRPYASYAQEPPNAKRTRYENGPPVGRASPPPYRDPPKAFPARQTNSFRDDYRDPRDINQRQAPYEKPLEKSKTWTNPSYSDRRHQNQGQYVSQQRNVSNGNGSYRDDNKYQRPRYRDDDRDIRSSNSSRSVSPPRRMESAANFGFSSRGDDRASYRDLESASNRLRSTSDAKRPAELPAKPSYNTNTPSLTQPELFNSYNLTSPKIPGLTHTRQETQAPLADATVSAEENISSVIAGLKSTMRGPDAWMTVAAQYRRRGMHTHALAVVDTMLEVMRDRGMDKTTLRPALLLKAQCHHSLGHLNKGVPETKEGSDQHFVKVLDWLRESYGPNTPAMDSILQAGSRSSFTSENGDYVARDPTDPFSKPPGLFDTHNAAASRADALAIENAKLRERQTILLAELATIRLRKDETEALLREKDGKLTRAIEDGRVEAARAARETDMRRRLEEKFAADRKAWDARTPELREEGARYAVRDLAAILSVSSRSPLASLEATRSFCESRGRLDKPMPP